MTIIVPHTCKTGLYKTYNLYLLKIYASKPFLYDHHFYNELTKYVGLVLKPLLIEWQTFRPNKDLILSNDLVSRNLD